MNPLEDRLHDYLSQFDDEPAIAPSLRRSAYLEQLLIKAGIVPTSSIELPAHMTPELLNSLLTQGDELMTNQSNPTRVRICNHITQSRFLHVEDALAIGKVRIFAGRYRRSEGTEAHGFHFIDLADARVLFKALARGEQGFRHKEYKGTPPQNGNSTISRVLSIAVKGEKVYIELKTGPGKLTNTGAITPNGPAKVEVNVGFKLYEARRMAASVLAYIHAWDVMRMMCHHGVIADQQMVSRPLPYLLVPATSAANDIRSAPANGVPKPNGATKPPVVANGRPVTRKDSVPKANGAAMKQGNGQLKKPDTTFTEQQPRSQAEVAVVETQLLKYGDGSMVDGQNLTEVQTFQRYVAEKKAAPESKAVLLDYYQQQVQTPVSVAS
ncbi:MAG: hypothetical protein KC441_00670 [Anaerolineales bacterium]|nr:hypothetical protein [Anaerolineales bacterium]